MRSIQTTNVGTAESGRLSLNDNDQGRLFPDSKRPIGQKLDTSIAFTGNSSPAAVPNASDDHQETVRGVPPPPVLRPVNVATARAADKQVRRQLIASLDDNQLAKVRGGLDLGSGVELNFAFQQATFVDHNLVQNVVIPTITLAQNTVSGGGGPIVSNAPVGDTHTPTFSTASLAGLNMTGTPSGTATTVGGASTIISNGTSLQITSPGAAIPTVLGNGAASIVTTLGAGGLTNIVANTANNQLVQQVTTINIGITGLQQLLQQSVPTNVMNQINLTSALRH